MGLNVNLLCRYWDIVCRVRNGAILHIPECVIWCLGAAGFGIHCRLGGPFRGRRVEQ